MPRNMYGVVRHRRRRRMKMRGGGLKDFLMKAHNFLKKHQLVSKIGGLLGSVGVPYAGTVGSVAGKLGYGRRRMPRGGALRLAGAGLSLAGRRRRIR